MELHVPSFREASKNVFLDVYWFFGFFIAFRVTHSPVSVLFRISVIVQFLVAFLTEMMKGVFFPLASPANSVIPVVKLSSMTL